MRNSCDGLSTICAPSNEPSTIIDKTLIRISSWIYNDINLYPFVVGALNWFCAQFIMMGKNIKRITISPVQTRKPNFKEVFNEKTNWPILLLCDNISTYRWIAMVTPENVNLKSVKIRVWQKINIWTCNKESNLKIDICFELNCTKHMWRRNELTKAEPVTHVETVLQSIESIMSGPSAKTKEPD